MSVVGISIISDPSIIGAIQGYKLEFIGSPPKQVVKPHPYRLSEFEAKAVDEEVKTFLEKDVIETTITEEGDFWSNTFCRPKKDRGSRMILDLSKLNKHLVYSHFKMDTFEVASKLISVES